MIVGRSLPAPCLARLSSVDVVASTIGLWLITVFDVRRCTARPRRLGAGGIVAGAVEARGRARKLHDHCGRSCRACTARRPAWLSSSTGRTGGCTRDPRSAPLDRLDARGRRLFPLGQAVRPRQVIWRAGFAVTLCCSRCCSSPTATLRHLRPLRLHPHEKTARPARRLSARAARRPRPSRVTLQRLRARDAITGRDPPKEIRPASANRSRSLARSRCWHRRHCAVGDGEDRGQRHVVVAPVSPPRRREGSTVGGRDRRRRALARRRLHVRRRCSRTPADGGRRCLGHHVARRHRTVGAFSALALLIGPLVVRPILRAVPEPLGNVSCS